MILQKIISIILVVCLLAALTTSASAVDIYSTMPEAEPLLKSSALMSTYDSGISVTAVEPSDLDDFLSYGNGTVAQWLNYIYWFLNGSGTAYRPIITLPDILTGQSDILTSISKSLYSSGSYLDYDGGLAPTDRISLAEYVRNGFLGLSSNIYAVTSAIKSLDFNDYSIILNSIYSSVDGLESGLTSANTAIGGVTTAVNNVRTAVNNVVSGLSTVNTSVGLFKDSVLSLFAIPNGNPFLSRFGLESSTVTHKFTDIVRFGFLGLGNLLRGSSGQVYLDSFGNVSNLSSDQSLTSIFRLGLVGIRSYLNTQLSLPSGYVTLDQNGKNLTIDKPWTLSDVLSIAFRGISANIKGSEYDNIYTSTLNDNNNTTMTVNSTGLGPLLNNQLSNIGENLGHLAYVFANDEDIKLREDSQPLLDTTDSFYDDSDSNVKISTNNVGSLKDIAGNFTSIIDADADIGDAFAIVSNSNTYRWFSADTAMNLDSLGVATVDFDESTYDRLYREFNEMYFPDRVGGVS